MPEKHWKSVVLVSDKSNGWGSEVIDVVKQREAHGSNEEEHRGDKCKGIVLYKCHLPTN